MRIRSIVAAVAASAGLLLAGCGGNAPATPAAPTSSDPVAATSASAAPTWSSEAVTACRTFVNSVQNMTLLEAQVANFKQPTTKDELSLAATGWGLATAGMNLPANLGADAEPEVYQAMKAVNIALESSPVNSDLTSNTNYAKLNADAFSNALDVCTEVGVTG